MRHQGHTDLASSLDPITQHLSKSIHSFIYSLNKYFVYLFGQEPLLNTEKTFRRKTHTDPEYLPRAYDIPPGMNPAAEKTEVNQIKSSALKSFHSNSGDREKKFK